MKRLFILLLVVSAVYSVQAQDTLSLLFAGDVMQHMKQIESAHQGNGVYAYDACFSYVKKYIEAADLAVVNLETTLAGSPYSGYPAFCTPDELAVTLQSSGFDLLLTANNHSCDKGKIGIERTLKVLDSLNFTHTGTFYSKEQRDTTYPLLVEKNNFRIVFLNYTYGTNGIAIPAPTVVNLIDTLQMKADIAKAKSWNPDIIIAYVHWGLENKLSPSAEQLSLSNFLFNQGIRLVIGSHPHVLQRMEKREAVRDASASKVVVYSLGNFVSNMESANTEIGAMASIRLIKSGEDVVIDECAYRLTWTYKPVVAKETQFFILPIADYEEKASFFSTPEIYQRMKNSTASMRSLFQKENIGFIEYK